MNKDGFTLLEVMLFLAISSGLALIAFIGLGPRLRNVRFTDSVRGVEASINRAVAESEQGNNPSDKLICKIKGNSFEVTEAKDKLSHAGSSEDCVLNGLLMFFDQSSHSVRYQQIVSLRKQLDGCTTAFTPFIKQLNKYCTRPLAIDGERPSDDYRLTNGLEQRTAGGSFVVYAVHPETGQKMTAIGNGGVFVDDLSVCYGLGSRRASLNFSTKTIAPRVEFDNAC